MSTQLVMQNMQNGGTEISECQRYRYHLWRVVLGLHSSRCLFVMLNPSTADTTSDDPTIRKCRGFCQRWGFGVLSVVNLFAFRSTDPHGLLGIEDPTGPRNDWFILNEANKSDRIVLAWGSHPDLGDTFTSRSMSVQRLLVEHAPKVITLGRCKNGSPRHPLMVPYAQNPSR
jgi:hypothetical protein